MLSVLGSKCSLVPSPRIFHTLPLLVRESFGLKELSILGEREDPIPAAVKRAAHQFPIFATLRFCR